MQKDNFETSDTNEASFLVYGGFKYDIQRVGRKVFFIFEPKARDAIQRFKDIKFKIYKEIFEPK